MNIAMRENASYMRFFPLGLQISWVMDNLVCQAGGKRNGEIIHAVTWSCRFLTVNAFKHLSIIPLQQGLG